MQKQRIIFLAIGIILAFLAAYLVKIYLDQQKQIMEESKRQELAKMQENLRAHQVAVLVAKKDIPKGVSIEPDMVDTAIIPDLYLQPQAARSIDRISGMITLVPIPAGQQILLSQLAYEEKKFPKEGVLAAITPAGKRAITISVDNIGALVGMLRPQDSVDVIVTVNVPLQTQEGKIEKQTLVVPLFQNVLVLAVGQDMGGAPKEEARYQQKEATPPLITLALTPQEANLISFLQEQEAKIRLVLRSPADTQTQPLQPTGWDTLFSYLMPVQKITPKEETPKEEAKYIEIYRGLNKQKLPLSKE